MREDYLLTGALKPTNEAYAVAKIAGIKLCEAYNAQYGTDFAIVMPTNLYGPNDKFDLENSHILPALMRKMHTAKLAKQKSITLWGTGAARREFLFVDDLAAACIFIIKKAGYKDLINIGTGMDISIKEAAELMREIVGYKGDILYDNTKPDGVPQKLFNVDRLNQLGWKSTVNLKEGLQQTYQWYLNNIQ